MDQMSSIRSISKSMTLSGGNLSSCFGNISGNSLKTGTDLGPLLFCTTFLTCAINSLYPFQSIFLAYMAEIIPFTSAT